MRRRRALLAAGLVLAAVVAVVVAVLAWPRPTGEAIAGGDEGDTGASSPVAVAPLAAEPARLRGRVLLERPQDLPEGTELPEPPKLPEKPGPDGYDPSALDHEPGAAGPAMPLGPPPVGTCRAVAWRQGVKLGEATCDAEGGFALALKVVEGPATAVVVEMLVPGHLRAVLTAPAQSGVEAVLPTVALGPASWLDGQVIDRRGQPVAGVTIAATPLPGLGEPEPWRVSSGTGGEFTLDTVPSGPIRLRATGPGLAPSVVEAFAPERGVVIVVDGLQDLGGDVIGAPELVRRAQVRLEGSSLWPPLVQSANEKGGFLFSDLVDGVYGLVAIVPAEKPGDPEYASIPLENIAPGAHVSLALITAQRVPVRVVSPDGSPVARARVTLGYASVGLLQQIAETDESGEASLGPVVPGPYVVRADADGYLPSESAAVDVGGAAPERQTLTLVRPGRIVGTVVDDDGRPVPEASIVVDADTLYSPGEAMIRARTFGALQRAGSLGVTGGAVPPIPLVGEGEDEAGTWDQSDERGDFSLDLLMPGRYRLRAVHGAYASSATVTVDLSPGERESGIVLTLGRGEALSGRVLDGNRRPIAGARVELPDGSEVLTDAFGTFFAGHRRGKIKLIVRAPGMIPAVVEVDLDGGPVEIEQVLHPAEGGLAGRVRDGNDRPIAGVRVTLLPEDELTPTAVTWTDERGLFEFSKMSPGAGQIELDHPDYAPAGKRVRVPARLDREAPVELKLAAGWTLEVAVRAFGSGDPVAGARVEVDGQVWATDEAGEVRVMRLAGEKARVKVRALGYVGVESTVTRPDDGRVARVFDLDEASGIEGEVTDERGEPVAGAKVVVRTRGGTELAEVVTAVDGRWSVSELPAGDVEVEATPPAGLSDLLRPVTMQSDVRRGHITREVDLRFERR